MADSITEATIDGAGKVGEPKSVEDQIDEIKNALESLLGRSVEITSGGIVCRDRPLEKGREQELADHYYQQIRKLRREKPETNSFKEGWGRWLHIFK